MLNISEAEIISFNLSEEREWIRKMVKFGKKVRSSLPENNFN